MKSFSQNQILSTAVVVSILFHGVLLSVNFVLPKAFRFTSDAQKLDIVLVNTKHDRAPLKPKALAQANLDGGGMAKSDRTQSPIPNMNTHSNGAKPFTSQSKTTVSQQMRSDLMSRLREQAVQSPSEIKRHESKTTMPDQLAAPIISNESSRMLARRAAELALKVQDNESSPKKTYITPSTRETPIAHYYAALQSRIEQVGELNFPRSNGEKLYGQLIIAIPIYHDGTIYDAEGGPQIQQSSGNPALDKAAVQIVRYASPFGRFPPDMRKKYTDIWVLTVHFKFTREHGLESR